jgi:hypothetical protein
MSDEAKNVNDRIGAEERDQWISSLSQDDQKELRRQQLLQAAIAKVQPKPQPTDAEIAVMSDAEFRAYCRQFGF